jgi:PAS domain S-box-containing protein
VRDSGPSDPQARLEAVNRTLEEALPELARLNHSPMRTDAMVRALSDLDISRDRYAHLYDFAPVGYLSLSPTGQVAEMNLTASTMLGRTRSTLIRFPFMLCVAKREVSRFLEHLRRCRGTSGKVTSEMILRRPDGSELPSQLISSKLPASLWPGSVIYHTALIDLSEFRAEEDVLRRSERRFQSALRAARAGFWEMEVPAGNATWSDEFLGLLGLNGTLARASYETFLACLHRADRTPVERLLVKARHRRDSHFHLEVRVCLPRKRIRWLSLVGCMIRGDAGSPARLVGIGIDITERKRAEGLLREARSGSEQPIRERSAEVRGVNDELESQINERKRLERQLPDVAEREQRRIGQDLHDSLGQLVTGIRYLNDVLREKLVRKSLPEAADARRMAQLLDDLKSQIRQLARGLHPVPISAEGLMTALGQLADHFSKLHQICCRFDCPHPVWVANGVVATHLFRIAQEAVNNSIEHGQARVITVSLSATNGTLCLDILDDGCGRSHGAWRAKGIGLQIMKSRSEAIGGALQFVPASPRGMRVRCSVPLEVAEYRMTRP